MAGKRFLMAGGGTGGHVMPLLAVAEELRARGHEPYFIGTRTGFEQRLVPAHGFQLEHIAIGGFQGVGWKRKLQLLYQLPVSVWQCMASLRLHQPAACFSLGGYVAAPPVLASLLWGLPLALMEPNAMPGLVNRLCGRWARKALLSWPEAGTYFPAAAVELSGLPVRTAFFAIKPKLRAERFRVFITGGSQGSQTLNRAVRESWPLFLQSGLAVELVHQCGRQAGETLAIDFERSGLPGRVTPFVEDMAAEFAAADLVICRSGAGTVSELMAAGRPSILIPFPFAADDHQTKNAAALARAGAARMLRDKDWNGAAMFAVVKELIEGRDALENMAERALSLRKAGAAQRAADVLEEISGCRD